MHAKSLDHHSFTLKLNTHTQTTRTQIHSSTFECRYDLWNATVWYCGDDYAQVLERSALREIANNQSLHDRAADSKTKNRCKHRMTLLWNRLRRRRRGLHKELANLYSKLFSHILRPDFRVSHLTRRYRRLSARISRRMRSISIYSFKLELERVSRNSGMVIVKVNESFTSKICGKCGAYHRRLGGAKLFKCPDDACGHVAERDGSAARKILLLFLFSRTLKTTVMSFGHSCNGCSSIGREKQGSCRENLHMGNIVTQKKNTGKDSTHQSLSECRCVERG